jgi:hypothetical protein
LQEAGTRKQRSAVFLLILLSHCLIIESLLRKGKESALIKTAVSPPLLVYFLSPAPSLVGDAPKPDNSRKVVRKNRIFDTKPSAGLVPAAPSIAAAPAVPPIDWQAELELVSRNSDSEANTSNAYRDLSRSMSPAQLDWLRDHQMQPASPGIVWKEPRVEISKNGLPIVHINDHCVLVPIFLIPMVFCGIGHIEPNGDLFKHMHEPSPP